MDRMDLLAPRPAEKEEKILDDVASTIVRFGLETPSMFFLEATKPIAYFLSFSFLAVSAPVLEMFGLAGYDYASTFQKRENVERLMKKIEDKVNSKKLQKERDGRSR